MTNNQDPTPKEAPSTKPDLPMTKTEADGDDHYENYYSHTWYCVNCGRDTHRYVRKGLRAASVRIECDNCGCSL
jgi:hypothetical protein